ncbi:MAG: putative metalloprotease CJM1_0395 family protein [Methylobacter sp.]|nr:putative metalloprotease CJM1_0395 family protein [Methylobacter sp.]
MISSVSNIRLAAQRTDYSQQQQVASANNSDPDQEIKQDPALKPDNSKLTALKKIGELSEADLKVISELKQRDTEVRAHEAAHLSAAAGIALGGPSFVYQKGPNGIRYAIGGEVDIDTSEVAGDPAATLQKANTIRRAALAPAQPSGPDIQVAARATAMAARAQVELFQKNQDAQNGQKDYLGSKVDVSA